MRDRIKDLRAEARGRRQKAKRQEGRSEIFLCFSVPSVFSVNSV